MIDVMNSQIGGTHYTDMDIQPWEAMEAWLTPDEYRGYHKATAIGYLARERSKGGSIPLSGTSETSMSCCLNFFMPNPEFRESLGRFALPIFGRATLLSPCLGRGGDKSVAVPPDACYCGPASRLTILGTASALSSW